MARILITGFCSIPSPGRPGVQLGHIIEGLRRQHQVDVLSVRRDDQGHVEHMGETRYLRVPLPDEELTSQIAVFRRALRRQVDGADYDVVHFRDGWSGVTALEMQANHGFATVFDLARSPMAEPVLTDLATATELERAEKTCVRRADLILAPTEPSRQYLAGFTSASKIHVVPPGVNVDCFDWETLNLDSAPIVLYLGTLAPGRGVRVLLRSMLDVAAVSNAVLVLAGPASESFQASLKTAVQDLGLEGRVRLLGEVPHALAPAVIARATVCVAPGAAELSPKPTALFPTKILEYMACRRAVIAPARGTVKMLFRDGEEGLMFTPGAPDELAKKILLLLRDSKLRNRVANAGYEMVRSNCTASGTRRSLQRAYSWLAEQAAYRERLGQPQESGATLAPITELGLDLILRQQAGGRSEKFSAEGIGTEPLAPVSSATMEAGDVTRVEVLSVRDVETPTDSNASEPTMPEPTMPMEVVEEGTEEWDESLTVLEDDDTGSTDLGASKPSTVVTAPMDDSLVSGELSSRPARPDLQRPISDPLTRLSVPGPATLKPSPQEKTRVLAVSDIEEMSKPSAAQNAPRAGMPPHTSRLPSPGISPPSPPRKSSTAPLTSKVASPPRVRRPPPIPPMAIAPMSGAKTQVAKSPLATAVSAVPEKASTKEISKADEPT